MRYRTVLLGTLLVAAAALLALVMLGTQVSQRLGGPCTNGEQPVPTWCS